MTTPSDLIEEVARAICLSEGQDPDAFDVARICGPNNEPLPLWQFYAEQARAAAAVIIEACAKVAEEQAAQFLSPQYATGQPLSSFPERFACGACADAIRTLAPAKPDGEPDAQIGGARSIGKE